MKNIWKNSLIRKLNDRYIKKSDSFIFREFAKKLRKSSVIYKLNTHVSNIFCEANFFYMHIWKQPALRGMSIEFAEYLAKTLREIKSLTFDYK